MAPTPPRLHALALLLGLFAFACGSEEGGATRTPGEPGAGTPQEEAPFAESGPLVVFLGDSLTAGLHLARDDAFPALLAERLAERGLSFEIVNAGVSGDTAAGGRRRIEWVLRQDPDVVVVQLGANDGLRGGSLEALEQDLLAIVIRAREGGARVLLLGMHVPPSLGEEYAADFAAIYERVARETGVAFVPSFLEGVGGVEEMNLFDQLHPNQRGHERLADNVEPALTELLENLHR